jgi:hypothetical protein
MWRQIAPVAISILIIILVAVVRAHSKTLAAITATMPITVPLALWIVYKAEGGDQAAVVSFTASLFIGVVATTACVVAMWVAARAGWRLVSIIIVGYLAWGLTCAVCLGLRHVLSGQP